MSFLLIIILSAAAAANTSIHIDCFCPFCLQQTAMASEATKTVERAGRASLNMHA